MDFTALDLSRVTTASSIAKNFHGFKAVAKVRYAEEPMTDRRLENRNY